jgi:hypothetical protein
MAVTRLGLGGYSTANLWPGGTGGSVVDFAGVFPDIAPVLAGDLAVTLASFVDLAGALSTVPALTGAFDATTATTVDFAGNLVIASALAADFTGNITSGSKYGRGPYGVGPYSRMGPEGSVTLMGDLDVQTVFAGSLDVSPKVESGWVPAEPCPPSMWTPVDPCGVEPVLELVKGK